MDRKPPSKLDPHAMSLVAMRRDESLSYREMASAMKARHRVSVSYRTIQNWFRHHPELAEDQATATPDEHDVANAASPAREQAESVQAPPSPPAEDLAALRAALDELTMKHRHLQARSAAQEAEIIALTEQRSTPEVPPTPSLPVPVYGGSWEHDLPLLPGEPLDITPASRPRLLRRVLTLGVTVLLLTLGALALYTAFQDTFTRAYVTVMRAHGPFVLLEAALAIAGLGLGLRVKVLVPVGLALVTYLLMLRNAHIPFFIALALTLQVSKALINGRW